MTNTKTSERRITFPMTKIKIIYSAPRMSSGHPGIRASRRSEIWAAISCDGVWSYERSDEPGTPWIVTHEPTRHVEYFASLPKARRWTASERAIPGIRRVLVARQLDTQTRTEASRCLVTLTALTILAA
jgi:hypothetical protein